MIQVCYIVHGCCSPHKLTCKRPKHSCLRHPQTQKYVHVKTQYTCAFPQRACANSPAERFWERQCVANRVPLKHITGAWWDGHARECFLARRSSIATFRNGRSTKTLRSTKCLSPSWNVRPPNQSHSAEGVHMSAQWSLWISAGEPADQLQNITSNKQQQDPSPEAKMIHNLF